MNPAASSPEAVTGSVHCGQQVICCKTTFCPNDTAISWLKCLPCSSEVSLYLVKLHLYPSGPAITWHWNNGPFPQGSETKSSEEQEAKGCEKPLFLRGNMSLGKVFCKGRNAERNRIVRL